MEVTPNFGDILGDDAGSLVLGTKDNTCMKKHWMMLFYELPLANRQLAPYTSSEDDMTCYLIRDCVLMEILFVSGLRELLVCLLDIGRYLSQISVYE